MQTSTDTPHEKIFNMLVNQDEITWKSIIHELVNTGQINPWDVDVSILTNKYIETVKKLQELDLMVSGKVVLAAALLLKMKSNRLVGEDLDQLDRLFSQTDEAEELLDDDLIPEKRDPVRADLIPRVPQPRKRKVSVYDLVNALEKALEVKKRRVLHSMPPTNIKIPEKKKDITQIIREVYGNIKSFFSRTNKKTLLFSNLIPSGSKADKVFTFIPLLHLTNQRKIDLEQYKHFGDIHIFLKENKVVNKELETS